MGLGATFRIGSDLVQNPLGAWLGFGTQPCYDTPDSL